MAEGEVASIDGDDLEEDVNIPEDYSEQLEDEDRISERLHGNCKLTDEVHKTIVDAIRRGNFITTACTLAGVNRTTFYRWCETGRKHPLGKYGRFLRDVIKANAECEDILVTIIQGSAVRGDVEAAKYILRCKAPRRWNPKERQVVEQGTNKIEVEFVNAADGNEKRDGQVKV